MRQQRAVNRPADLLKQYEVRLQLAEQFDLGVQQSSRPGIDVPAHHPQAHRNRQSLLLVRSPVLRDPMDLGDEPPYRTEAPQLEVFAGPLPVGRFEDRLLVEPLADRQAR